MKRRLLLSTSVLLILGAIAAPGASAAGCVRVLGYESDGEKQSMDPAALIGTDNAYHVRAVYEPLIDRSNDMQPVPVLASSWESNADATQWTVHLREGVTFHSGKPFTAKDVVFSYKRLLDPAISPGGFTTLSFLDPAGITALDDHTVRFTVKKPVVELPTLIATKYALMVPDASTPDQLRLQGDGTGLSPRKPSPSTGLCGSCAGIRTIGGRASRRPSVLRSRQAWSRPRACPPSSRARPTSRSSSIRSVS